MIEGGTMGPMIDEAARRGYDTRAGLEDTILMPDGTRARDNAQIVAEAARRIAAVKAAIEIGSFRTARSASTPKPLHDRVRRRSSL